MSEFLDALSEHAFLRRALLAGALVSIACGVVGAFVVTRRITYIAGGIAHCVLGGIGAAQYFRVTRQWEWCHPLYGAVAAALASALVIGWVSLRLKEREDTIIGALWATGMAVGVLFIAKTPGYSEDLMGYLFGDILMVTQDKLWLIAALDLLVLGLVFAFYDQLLAVCFDQEFAEMRGVPVGFYYLLLLCITALTVVLLVTVVGIVMVIALLTLPVAIAGHFARSLWQMMLVSVGLTVCFTSAGLAVSYGPNLPAGATTIMIAATTYALVLAGSKLLGRRSA